MNNENFDLDLNMDVENFNLTPNDEDEEFTVEFGEIFNDGGTHDYDELDNKPQINSHTLEGNKTGEQLGLQDKISDLSTIRSGAAKGATAVQPRDLARVATTGNYNDLNNKPTIPTVNDGTLTIQRNGSTVANFTANSSTNRTANISVPTATSQLVNDSGYTTNTGTITSVKMNGSTVATSGEANLGTVITDVSEKQNITDNTLETNSKTVPGAINEVNSIAKGANQALSFANYPFMINDFNVAPNDAYQIGQNVMIVMISVPDLWVSGIESTSVRYTYRGDSTFIDELSENGYVQVGYYKLSALETQKVDLTDYVTNTDYADSGTGGVIKTGASYGTTMTSSGNLRAVVKNYEEYSSAGDYMLVGKGTLENAIEGKGLVSNTDYGSFATAGVIKASSTYGTQFASTGAMYAQTKTYEQYTDSTSPGLFIGKGTLENVIEGKGLVSNTDYASNATAGVIRTSNNYGTTVSGSGVLNASTLPYETYTGANDTTLIGKGTLENVITGKGLVNNTDYASLNTGGVVRVNPSYGINAASTGTLIGVTKDYANYTSGSDLTLIDKGTLENVITGKGLVDQTALAGKQDTLTAGTGINITNNVISATGGGTVSGETIYYGLSSTNGTSQAKTVTVDSGFTLHDGAAVRVLFANGQTYNGAPTLNVNDTGAKTIQYKSGTNATRYIWTSGQVVDFVYRQSSDVWIMVMGGLASTSYYGLAKLVTSAASDSQSLALTPRALFYLANYSIAPFYSASSTYAVGDKVRYGYYLYECITAINTPEAWTEAHWQQIDPLQTQIDALEARIRALENSQ